MRVFYLVQIMLLSLFMQPLKAQSWTMDTKTTQSLSISQEYSMYGFSVDIDGNYAVVGCCGYNNYSGCAYVLYNNGSSWSTVAVLTPQNVEEEDNFAESVSISGDYIAIGVGGKESVYIFKKPFDGWEDMNETAKLSLSEENEGSFIECVSISDDCVVVGANHGYRGSVYVFEKPIEGWVDMTPTAKLSITDEVDFDSFGSAVCISGDCIVVGTAYSDYPLKTAYVFEKPITGWEDMTETARLNGSDVKETDNFGFSVSVSGDCVVVGANPCDVGVMGSAYIFEKPITGWEDMSQTAKLTASDYTSGDCFGVSVSISGDYVVVGASTYETETGFIYIYKKEAEGWSDMTETNKLVSSDQQEGDCFSFVAISGDNIVVGAPGADNDYGSAYFYKKNNNPTGVELGKDREVKVYPNPTTNWLIIKGKDEPTVNIYSIKGVLLFSQKCDKVDMSNLKAGTYVVDIDGEKYKVLKK